MNNEAELAIIIFLGVFFYVVHYNFKLGQAYLKKVENDAAETDEKGKKGYKFNQESASTNSLSKSDVVVEDWNTDVTGDILFGTGIDLETNSYVGNSELDLPENIDSKEAVDTQIDEPAETNESTEFKVVQFHTFDLDQSFYDKPSYLKGKRVEEDSEKDAPVDKKVDLDNHDEPPCLSKARMGDLLAGRIKREMEIEYDANEIDEIILQSYKGLV